MNTLGGNIHPNINRKEENKFINSNFNQLPRFRAGLKPDWVQNNSSDEDIFNENLDDSRKSSKFDMTKTIDLNKQIINQIEITDRRLRRLVDNKNITEKIEKKERINTKINRKRELYKSEIVNTVGESIIESTKINLKRDATTNPTKIYQPNEENKIEISVLIDVRIDRKKNEHNKFIHHNDYELIELLEEAGESGNVVENSNSLVELDENNSKYDEEEVLMRPIFMKKAERITINDEKEKENEQNEILYREAKIKENKKTHSLEMVVKYIKEENMNNTVHEEYFKANKLPDDIDNQNDLVEYEKWKLREFRRIKRQVEEDQIKLNEKLEIERRRSLTNEQRKEENLRLGSDDTLRPFKSKINFMQRYYHKGAFFQNESQGNLEHVFSRDYNMPIAEEKRDLSDLPKILQKRRGNLFKKGQSKYTHLTGEDTTCFDPNFKIPEHIVSKMLNISGGLKGKECFELTRKKFT